jgi:hypothetical protein
VNAGPIGGRVVWSKLVQPSYRTIDLRPLLDDASQVLPVSPFDVIHLVTAQDLVQVQLTVTEHFGPPDHHPAAQAHVTGTVDLPSGRLYVDPPAAPLPDRLELSKAGPFAYAAYQENGPQTEAAIQAAVREHLDDDPPAGLADLDTYIGQERWTVHLWPSR